jgi:hypothetical protein
MRPQSFSSIARRIRLTAVAGSSVAESAAVCLGYDISPRRLNVRFPITILDIFGCPDSFWPDRVLPQLDLINATPCKGEPTEQDKWLPSASHNTSSVADLNPAIWT